jgi:hypothetical protein
LLFRVLRGRKLGPELAEPPKNSEIEGCMEMTVQKVWEDQREEREQKLKTGRTGGLSAMASSWGAGDSVV